MLGTGKEGLEMIKNFTLFAEDIYLFGYILKPSF